MEDTWAVLAAIRGDDVRELRNLVPERIKPFMCLDLRTFETDPILRAQPPLLAISVYFGAEKCAKYLIDCGAGLDSTDSAGREPVHFLASPHDVMRTFHLLVSHRAVFTVTDDSDMTVLHYLAKTQQVQLVREILTKRLCEGTKSSKGETPFHVAVSNSNPEMVKLMLALRGIGQIYETNAAGLNALELAKRANNSEILKILTDAVPVDRLWEGGKGPVKLVEAARKGNLKMAAGALESGEDVNKVDTNGLSPLSYAVMNEHVEMVKWLLEHQASPVIGSPMKYAIASGSLAMVELLVKYLPDINGVDDNNQRPLGYAVDGKFSPEVFDLLVRSGADIAVGSSDAVAPIEIIVRVRNPRIIEAMARNKIPLDVNMRYSLTHAAAEVNDCDFLSVILRNGGDVNFCHQGVTPLGLVLTDSLSSDDFAARQDIIYLLRNQHFEEHFARALLLLENGASFGNLFENAIESNDQLTVFFLLMMGAPVPRNSSALGVNTLIWELISFFEGKRHSDVVWLMKDNSLLHLAVQFSPLSVVKVLLERGLDIDTPDADGLRPIHRALLKCRFATANLLIEYCANLLPPSIEMPSLLHLVAGNIDMVKWRTLSQQFNYTAVDRFVKLILENGTSIDCADVNGVTPLGLACKTRNFRFVEVLLRNGARNEWGSDYSFFKNLLEAAPLEFSSKFSNEDLTIGTSPHLDINPDHEKFIVDTELTTISVVRLMALYISSGHPVNDVVDGSNGATPLHLASAKSMSTICRFLILNGARLDCLDAQRLSPVATALGSGNTAFIKEFFANVTDFNIRDVHGRTPFLHACEKQGREILKLMIEKGACFSLRDHSGSGPLHFAARQGNIDGLEFLLSDCKCSPVHKDYKQRTPVHIAVKYGHMEIVQRLWQTKSVAVIRDVNGNTPLHYAVIHGHTDIVRFMCSNPSLALEQNRKGETPMTLAASKRNRTLTDYFFSLGLRFLPCQSYHALRGAVDARDMPYFGFLLHKGLIVSVREHKYSIVDYIVERNAVHALNHLLRDKRLDPTDMTPLALAYVCGQRQCFDKLLSCYPKENPSDLLDRVIPKLSELVQTSDDQRVQLVKQVKKVGAAHIPHKLLRDSGFGIDSETNLSNALWLAFEMKNLNMAKCFLEHGANPNSRSSAGTPLLYEAARTHDLLFLDLFLSFGANPSKVDLSTGCSAVHQAIVLNKLDTLMSLISYGADLNFVDSKRTSAITVAIANRRESLISVLIDSGANVNVKDCTGMTPLHWAVQYGNVEAVKILLRYGGDPSLEDDHGKTARDLAVTSNRRDLIQAVFAPSD